MATILVVEDDKNSGYLIKRNLVKAGYEVILSVDGEEGLQQFTAESIDLCILDIMLPKRDGLALAKEIRKKNEQVPFIFLSARIMVEDRIEGFKVGCDDYITKPFNLEELLLRIKVVMNRRALEPDSTQLKCPVKVGSYDFNHLERVLHIGSKQCTLSSKESDLLKTLVLYQNEVVSRSHILTEIWGKDDYYASKSLDVYLTKVRKLVKIMKGVELQNIHGYGYKLTIQSA